ncbi:hypothetical protein LINPERPRIM_LOCUS28860, partial [Linum perenne]
QKFSTCSQLRNQQPPSHILALATVTHHRWSHSFADVRPDADRTDRLRYVGHLPPRTSIRSFEIRVREPNRRLAPSLPPHAISNLVAAGPRQPRHQPSIRLV